MASECFWLTNFKITRSILLVVFLPRGSFEFCVNHWWKLCGSCILFNTFWITFYLCWKLLNFKLNVKWWWLKSYWKIHFWNFCHVWNSTISWVYPGYDFVDYFHQKFLRIHIYFPFLSASFFTTIINRIILSKCNLEMWT